MEKKGNTKISLDHIIKERYPTFIDALRDLDDALSLLSLFANLPATATVPPKKIALCQRLCLEFQHYLITTKSLRKSFLSIKGIYYQATIQGQDILWLVPYKFVQRVTGDVDFRIMGTFVEFYTTLLGFVNFRLYNSIGLIYPPKFDQSSDEQGGELGAFTLEGKEIDGSDPPDLQVNGQISGTIEPDPEFQKKADAIVELSRETEVEDNQRLEQPGANETTDTFEITGEGADVLPLPQISSVEAGNLFSTFTFFLSRETPKQPLEFLLRAFGCKRIAWDAVLGDGAFTHNEHDTTITHQVVDRPPVTQTSFAEAKTSNGQELNHIITQSSTSSDGRMPGRTYVQPQWIWDCINEGKLLRPDLYAPGATLPPHLSPWVKPTKGEYDPSVPLAEQEREGEAEEAEGLDIDDATESEEESAEEAKEADLKDSGETTKPKPKASPASTNIIDPHGMDIANSASSDSDASIPSATSSFTGFDADDNAQDSSSEPSALQTQHQRELEAEAAGLSFAEGRIDDNAPAGKSMLKGSRGEAARKKAGKKRRAEEEELERRKMMMGRKKRKLLEKMLYANRKRDDEAERLRGKRRRIENRAGVGGLAGVVS